MAIFTAIATAISTAFFAGSAIATSLIAGGLALATSYAVRALTGQPQQQSGADAFGVQASSPAAATCRDRSASAIT